MVSLFGYTFDKRSLAVLLGLTFLWPCLQASGFYPLSIASAVSSLDPTLVAKYHVWYSVALIVFVVVAVLLREKLEAFLSERRFALVVFGLLGFVGHLLLMGADPSLEFFSIQIVVGVCFIAAFIVPSILLWGTRIAQGDVRRAVFLVALSFLLSQIILTLYYVAGFSQGYLLMICPLIGAICAVFSVQGNPRETSFEFRTLRRLPWPMLAPALFLVYFCVIFIRLLIEGFSGDANILSKLVAGLVGVAAFSIVVVYLTRKIELKNKLVTIFAFLAVVYIIALAAMLLLDYRDTPVRRGLVGTEHCFEAFVWMLLVYAIIRKHLSSVLVFGFYTVFVVAVPWMISFDLFYLTDLHLIIPRDEILVPAVTVASLIAAISTIIFLVSYAFKLGRESAQSKDDWQKVLVTNALTGVEPTPREVEVGVLVYRGYSAKKISEMLFVSEPTVKSYTTQIYRKLGIHSKQEFISFVDSCRESMSDL